MSSSFQISYTLKQQTPVLQFQWMELGSTLRSSEFKAKFDRWIIEQEKGKQENYADTQIKFKEDHPEWLVGQGALHVSLDYKIQVDPGNTEFWFIPKQYPCYFGNMAPDKNSHKHLVISHGAIHLIFTCFHPGVTALIKKHFDTFLAHENFGTRQSKGFGGFSRAELQQSEFEHHLTSVFDAVYRKDLKLREWDSPENQFKELFKIIEKEYKVLKAGDAAQKKESKLREYFNNKSPRIEWEKPAMQEVVSRHSRAININSKSNTRKYVRALLGLAENFEYPKNDDIKIKVEHIPDGKELKIDRYRSPITVKVFNQWIYFCANKSTPLSILDRKFQFTFSKKERLIKDEKPLFLDTPTQKDNWDIIDFMQKGLSGWKRLK